MTRSTRALLLALAALTQAACGSRAIPIEIDFTPDSLADDATAIELFVVDRCSDVPRGEVPSSPRASLAFRRDETPRALPEVLPERFGVAVIARGDGCGVVGAGCVDASREVSSLRIEVTAVTSDARCSASETCDDGLCAPGAIDAGADAVSPDAFSPIDAPHDAGRDAGGDAPDGFAPELGCDCTDDDADGRVDEGCVAAGAGEPLWETLVDAAGTQAFRGAAAGGDGRVYVNGWMDTAGASVSLCGDGPFVGLGLAAGASSYTVGLDATSGACTSALESTSTTMPASSVFAFPRSGRRGVWIFGGMTLGEISGLTVVETMPMGQGAGFGIGDVLARPGSSTDSLVTWWGGAPAPTLLGMPVDGSGQDPVVIVTGATPTVMASTSIPRAAQAGWLDADHLFVVSPNVAAGGFPCVNPTEPMSFGATRLEVRDASMLVRCTDAFGLDLDTSGAGERSAVASGPRVWFLSLEGESYVLGVVDTSTRETAHVTIRTADTSVDTVTHLVPTAGGRVVFGGALVRDRGAGPNTEGVIVRFDLVGGEIVEIGRRWSGRAIVGLGVRAEGRVVYANASVDGTAARCTGADLPTDGPGTLVSAIDFGP